MLSMRLFEKINKNFFFAHIGCVILFALLYQLQDNFILNNIDFAQKIGLMEKNIPKKYYSWKSSPFYYYIWYSLITQTTVGYGGVVDTATGDTVSFIQIPNRLFKILNVIQLLSVILIAAVF